MIIIFEITKNVKFNINGIVFLHYFYFNNFFIILSLYLFTSIRHIPVVFIYIVSVNNYDLVDLVITVIRPIDIIHFTIFLLHSYEEQCCFVY